ncbi:hypothetical protein KQI86_11600 [Clostridium sp. MSJ-11]|uniref:Uncharacterized protein n=1 Tax=Clostridium mobile TaxID=2841512 RepID=A0ABS6EID9_9CLOT|nr:hypothetical protein [Clostridium mobile]MBU5484981.1 hypothetical protein [Clostridium mobile]
MADKKVGDLDNLENAAENTIASLVNMGVFNQAISGISPITLLTPPPPYFEPNANNSEDNEEINPEKDTFKE